MVAVGQTLRVARVPVAVNSKTLGRIAKRAQICSRKWRILALVNNKPLNFLSS